MVILFTLPDNAANATKPEVLSQRILHQVAALRNKVVKHLTKKLAKYKWYFEKKVRTLRALTIRQQVYVDHFLFVLNADDKKSSTWHRKLFQGKTRSCVVMDVKRHVVNIDKHGTPSTKSIGRAQLTPTRAHRTTRITPNGGPPTRTTVAHNTDIEWK